MSHHYSGPKWAFLYGDARLSLTDLFAGRGTMEFVRYQVAAPVTLLLKTSEAVSECKSIRKAGATR